MAPGAERSGAPPERRSGYALASTARKAQELGDQDGGCACGPAETSSALNPVVEPGEYDLQYAFAANVIQELVIAAVLDQ